MTPLQAIEAATANGPLTVGPQAPSSGQLLEGFDADVICLDADPLDDIGVLADPRSRHSRVQSRTARQGLRLEAAPAMPDGPVRAGSGRPRPSVAPTREESSVRVVAPVVGVSLHVVDGVGDLTFALQNRLVESTLPDRCGNSRTPGRAGRSCLEAPDELGESPPAWRPGDSSPSSINTTKCTWFGMMANACGVACEVDPIASNHAPSTIRPSGDGSRTDDRTEPKRCLRSAAQIVTRYVPSIYRCPGSLTDRRESR
jgi:hypothetical protein